MDLQSADRLLDLLGSDDLFRQLFQNDPRAALELIGFAASASDDSPAWCFFGISTLASKEQIAEARAEIRNMLLQGLAQDIPKLDVGLKKQHRIA